MVLIDKYLHHETMIQNVIVQLRFFMSFVAMVMVTMLVMIAVVRSFRPTFTFLTTFFLISKLLKLDRGLTLRGTTIPDKLLLVGFV